MPAVTRNASSPHPLQQTRTPSSTKKPRTKARATTQPFSSNGLALPQEPTGPEFSEDVKFVDPKTVRPIASSEISKKSGSRRKARPRDEPPPPPPSKSFFRSFIDTSSRVFLILFILYLIVVCPEDTHLESAACRTLSHYQKSFLEPAIYAPVRELAKDPYFEPFWVEVQPHVDAFKRVVVPYYTVTIQHLRIWYDSYLEISGPYLHRIEAVYYEHVEPYIRELAFYYRKYYRLSEPYVRQFFALLLKQWDQIKPYVYVAWEEVNQWRLWVATNVLRPLYGLKRDYVDVHVGKILQKVEEMVENGSLKGTTADDAKVAETSEAEDQSVDPAVPEITPSPSSTLLSRENVPESTPHRYPAGGVSASSVGQSSEDDDFDIDAFLDSLTPPPPEPEPTAEPEETEEEKAEKKRLKDIETAQKRANIDRRHTEYEEQIIAMEERHEKEIKEVAETTYGRAAVELDGVIEEKIKELENEATQVLKGAEVYAKKLASSSTSPLERVTLFVSIVEKVLDKYKNSWEEVRQFLQEWVEGFEGEVAVKVKSNVNEIRDFALDAQAALGMDYAWLADVQVKDWTRYHALTGTAKAAGTTYWALADISSYPRLPSALAAVKTELENIMVSFEDELEAVEQMGLDMFGESAECEEEDVEEPTVSILPIAEDVAFDESQVVLGRGAKEVENAMSMAEEAATTTSAGTNETEPSSIHHEEL